MSKKNLLPIIVGSLAVIILSIVVIVLGLLLISSNATTNTIAISTPSTTIQAVTSTPENTVAATATALPATPTVSPVTPTASPTPVSTSTVVPTTNPITTQAATPIPSTPAPAPANVPPAIQGLHVSGNKIVNGQDQPVRLLGVNRSGTEYACIQGWGLFDGPNDAASVDAMSSWHINTVRLPLNEGCWLNINNSSSFSGQIYRQAIVDYVNLLNSKSLIVILDLHWSAPGDIPATGQQPMANQDHSLNFWSSVATTFKNNSSVIFDLFNEPFLGSNPGSSSQDYSNTTETWQCWRDGGSACTDIPYLPANLKVAGMQQLVNAVRDSQSKNIVLVGGTAYSNSLQNWLTFKPNDPLNNMAASWHGYNYNSCNTVECWQQYVKPVLTQVPLIAGEISENNCTDNFIKGLLDWFDTNDASYVAWSWNTYDCAFPSLITDYAKGTPKPGFGQAYYDHLASLATKQAVATPTELPKYMLNIWWPTSMASLSGTQPFKATLSNLDIKQYNIYWQLSSGPLNLMKDNTKDGPHKESVVNVSAWIMSGSRLFTINFLAKDLSGATLQQKSVQVSVSAIKSPVVNNPPPKPNYVLNIWWPTNNSTMSGVQPFKAALNDLDIKNYNIFWQLEVGPLNQMDNNTTDGPHKEAAVDVSKFTAKGKGPYTINFVAKDLKGNILQQKSAQIFVGSDTPPATTPITPTTYTLSIWWPSTENPLTGNQPFKARLEELALNQYTMEWQVEGGPLFMMADNTTDGPHKEAMVDVSKFTGKGKGPYTVNFVAKDLAGKTLQQKSTRVFIEDAAAAQPGTPPASPVASPEPPVLSIWWPSDGAAVTGVQPFKARLENLDLNKYAMYWQVENSALTVMGDSNVDGPHKEVMVDVSKFSGKGKGPYTITFVAKDLAGKVIQQKSTRILVDTPANTPAPTSNTPTQYTLSIWWPTDGASVNGNQPFKARLENIELGKYNMYYQVDSNGPVLMGDNNTDGPHKEALVDVSKYGKGTHKVVFIARDLAGKELQKKSAQITVTS